MHLPDNTLLQRGKYRIIHYINGGGFGYTYEAEHVMLHKRVAIKEFFYKKETLRNADNSISIPSKNMERNLIPIKKKFIEEAIFLSQANHPNIISVTDVFEENETAYYVMDYIDGKSLSQILKEQGTLTETQAVDYICQVAEALKYVHSFNRLHLDIKPDNILVDSHSGRAILIDFGTCKHYDENSGEQTTGLLGMQTDGYAPIELANKTFSNFSPSTDVYELGATLYCLLSGVKPPIAASLSSGDEVIKPLPSHISANTRHAVECSLKLRRKDRPQNMDELLLILRGEREYEEKLTNDNEATYFEQSTTSTHLLRLNTHLQDGKYKIVQHLSSGGFGNIYEALHTMRQVRVAIKEFYVSGLNKREGQTNNVILSSQNHQEIVDRLRHIFKEEARFGFQMKHKHIIPVIDIFEENNTIYYAMEYIDGMNLSDIIRTEGPLPESKVLGIINQVADALKYIHSLKRLHLNVKPSNIIINKQGKAFLSVAEANEMYEGIHTVGYSPLEQITQKYSSWSPATDIYALGATLYKLLTGITPPDAQMLKDGEAELAPLLSGVSDSVKSAIKESMHPLRKDRPQSIEEFIVLLNGDGKTNTQKKNTEKPFDAKGSVNHNGKLDNESTLLDLDDKFFRDVKELCVQTGKSQAECEKALKQTKGNKRAALIKIQTEFLYEKCGCKELGIGRGTCKRYIEHFEGTIEKAEKGLSELLQERKHDVSTLFSEYKDIILGFDLNVCQKICADANWDREQAKCRLEKWAQNVQRENKNKKLIYHVSFRDRIEDIWLYIRIGLLFAGVLSVFCVIVSGVISKFSNDYQLWYDTYFFSILISALVLGFVLGVIVLVWITWDEITHPEIYHPERYKDV